MKKIHFVPHNDRILVSPSPTEDKTPGGIIVPDSADKLRPNTGTVIAVGPGKHSPKGVLIPITIKPGDKVLFPKNCFDEVSIGGESFYIMSESAVMGRFV